MKGMGEVTDVPLKKCPLMISVLGFLASILICLHFLTIVSMVFALVQLLIVIPTVSTKISTVRI
jgi:hypothetical protein